MPELACPCAPDVSRRSPCRIATLFRSRVAFHSKRFAFCDLRFAERGGKERTILEPMVWTCTDYPSGAVVDGFFFASKLIFSFWTSRDHRSVIPPPPPAQGRAFIIIAKRVSAFPTLVGFHQLCQPTLSRFPLVIFLPKKKSLPLRARVRVYTRGGTRTSEIDLSGYEADPR